MAAGRVRTAFKDLERNCKMKRNFFSLFFFFFMLCKWLTIHSHKAAEREFKATMFGVNFYTILPRYKYTDS